MYYVGYLLGKTPNPGEWLLLGQEGQRCGHGGEQNPPTVLGIILLLKQGGETWVFNSPALRMVLKLLSAVTM